MMEYLFAEMVLVNKFWVDLTVVWVFLVSEPPLKLQDQEFADASLYFPLLSPPCIKKQQHGRQE